MATFAGFASRRQLTQGELRGPGIDVLTLLRTFHATLTYKSVSTVQRVYVLLASITPLLGLSEIQALGVVRSAATPAEPEP